MSVFNPNDVGVANGNYFALPYSLEECKIALVSVPWDVTTSYRAGTSGGPQAILEASVQVDLFDESLPRAWETLIGTLPLDKTVIKHNKSARKIAEHVIEELAAGTDPEVLEKQVMQVNEASDQINEYVEGISAQLLRKGKRVGIVGGEHSVPLGLIRALGGQHDNFGVLHVDAHADLRAAYEGFQYSHASIMYNVLAEVPAVSRLTQVAVRDFCSDEHLLMQNDARVCAFTDKMLAQRKFEGETWRVLCDEIISTLPDKVYISFDIDGLIPELCPNTGTPVPGGLSFREADYLLERLVASGRQIIGFDLCEVAPAAEGEWDANVGARILFKLCLYTQNSMK